MYDEGPNRGDSLQALIRRCNCYGDYIKRVIGFTVKTLFSVFELGMNKRFLLSIFSVRPWFSSFDPPLMSTTCTTDRVGS